MMIEEKMTNQWTNAGEKNDMLRWPMVNIPLLDSGNDKDLPSHDDLYALFADDSRNVLIERLLPWVRRWVQDVLKATPQYQNYSYQEELMQAGSVKLVFEIDKRLSAKKMSSGEHLINSLRKPIRKSMKEVYRKMSIVVGPTQDVVCKRIQNGDDVCDKPWHLRKRVDLDVLLRHKSDPITGREIPVHAAFQAPCQEREKDYSRFLFLFCREASRLSRELECEKVVDLIWNSNMSVTEAARLSDTPRSTVRDRLRSLSYEIAASASEELDFLGQEHLGECWVAAAEKGRKRQRSRGEREQPSHSKKNTPSDFEFWKELSEKGKFFGKFRIDPAKKHSLGHGSMGKTSMSEEPTSTAS